MPPIILVDCHNVAHAAFHALGELDYHGRRTGVIYGFLYRIFSIAKKFGTSHFVFCWDSTKSIRRAYFKGYKDKSARKKQMTPAEVLDAKALHEQIEEMRTEVLPLLGFSNNLRRNGYEADDIIASVVKYGEFMNAWCAGGRPEFIIVSSDKDLYQLLSSCVRIYNLRSGSLYTESMFREEFGIAPSDWVLAKALGGCNSDTVPGIKGIADPAKSKRSRALQYLRGELEGKWKDAIECAAGNAIRDRNLSLVSIPVRPIVFVINEDVFKKELFYEVFDAYGFESFLRRDRLAEILEQFPICDA